MLLDIVWNYICSRWETLKGQKRMTFFQAAVSLYGMKLNLWAQTSGEVSVLLLRKAATKNYVGTVLVRKRQLLCTPNVRSHWSAIWMKLQEIKKPALCHENLQGLHNTTGRIIFIGHCFSPRGARGVWQTPFANLTLQRRLVREVLSRSVTSRLKTSHEPA